MTRANLDKNPGEVAAMFDRTSTRYDLMNHLMTGGIDVWWRRQVVAACDPTPGESVLDLGAGTGVSSEPFADLGCRTVPADFSLGMLRVGKRRRPDMDFTAADATRLPFADNVFDVVTISFALRNVVDFETGLREMLRVAKPGGRLVVCEFTQPPLTPIRLGYHHVVLRGLPAIAKVASSNPDSYEYLAESIKAWPDQATLADRIRSAGWEQAGWRNLTMGVVALHSARKPA